jgi:Spy/CpxP family protein refolding chaperone
MKNSLILALALGVALTPAAALAERGSTDTFVPQFTELSYKMMRDGQIQRLMEEGRANKAAFEALKQRELQQQSLQQPTYTGSVRRPR